MRHLQKISIYSGIIATSLLIGALPHAAHATPVAAPLHCTIDAGRYGKTVQDTQTTFDVSIPEQVAVGETFVAKFKLSDVQIRNDALKKIGSITMEKSSSQYTRWRQRPACRAPGRTRNIQWNPHNFRQIDSFTPPRHPHNLGTGTQHQTPSHRRQFCCF